MNPSRRTLLALAAASALPGTARAQSTFPRGPVRIIVPFPPGGPVDVTGRAMAQKLTELWGAQVSVENRSGGNSVIGAEAASRAAPDGQTIFLGAIHQSVLPGFGNKLPYDIEKDFTPVMFGEIGRAHV